MSRKYHVMATAPDNCYWVISNDKSLIHEHGGELEKNGFIVMCILPMYNVLCVRPSKYLDDAPNEKVLNTLPFVKNFKWMKYGSIFPTPGLSN